MSQLIRSFLIGRPRFGSIFWWLLSGYFFRPLSVEIVVFDTWIVLFFYRKREIGDPYRTCAVFWFLIKRLEIEFRLPCASFAAFFFSLFFALISWNRCFALFSGHQCSKNVELSHILVVKSLFCFVFRTSVLQKRRTVAHFGREIIVLLCFPDISVAKT